MFSGVQLAQLDVSDQHITLHGASTATSATCPACATTTTRVHRAYTRTLADLPWSGWAVHLRLRVRRFFCPTPTCARVTFVEQIPALTQPYAQHTTRLNDLLGNLGLALGGEAGHRLSRRLAVSVSPDTLLRRVRRLPLPPTPAPTTIGVDEWAKRKGYHYGAIVVDLEQHQVVDLLPDDSAARFAAWLRAHPGVQVIARDRANSFAQGAQQGAPTALQVADRWHLTHNLRDALHALLQRHTTALRAAAVAVAPPLSPDPLPATSSAADLPAWPQGHSYGPVELRQEQFQHAKALHAQGWSYRQIAQHLQLHWRTARTYVHADELPRRILPQTTSSLTPYAEVIRASIADGPPTGTELWQTLQAQGYRGSLSSVYRAMRYVLPGDRRQGRRGPRRRPTPGVARPEPLPPALSPRQATWLLLRQTEQLDPEEVAYRERLCAACPEVAVAYPLAHRFLAMIRERQGAALDARLADAHASGVPELKRFATSLRRDAAPVRAALDTPWSTGQVEGQIHRLKLVKRMMDGRASFELLRRRVLMAV